MTALNALMLIGITLLLTWRERDVHRQVHDLVSVDGHIVSVFEQAARMQNAFANQIEAASLDDPAALAGVARRYPVISQPLSEPLIAGDADVADVHRRLKEFGRTLQQSADAWADDSTEQRDVVRGELRRDSDVLQDFVQRLAFVRQGEIDRRIPDLELSAAHTMYVAIGIVYIVAIISFMIAKMTLAKVVTPLERLAEVTARVKEGDYSSRVALAGDHEIAELSSRFNDMMDSLATMTDRLATQASTDDLTALPNFRSFQKTIQLEIERASRYEQTFGVLVFDLDHFKRYNDSFGHLAGNEALQAVAGVIRKAMRAADTPARYGGEEFAAIAPQIDAAALTVIAERIRSGIEQLPVPKGRTVLTVSVGGALYPSDGRTAAELFAVADARLYEAKKGGRNRVVIPVPRATRLIS
jgi:diguanylate cyclase (GGDEF)-like protein